MTKQFLSRYKEAQGIRWNFYYWVSHAFVGYFDENAMPMLFKPSVIFQLLKEKIKLEKDLFKYVFLNKKVDLS